MENELLQYTTEELARFLCKGKGLKETAMGKREELSLAAL